MKQRLRTKPWTVGEPVESKQSTKLSKRAVNQSKKKGSKLPEKGEAIEIP